MKQKKLIGDYVLCEKLGKGSFGNVFLGFHKNNESTKLAIKQLDKSKLTENNDYLINFQNEVLILQNIKHPNIVKLHHVVATQNHYYMIQEYCNGGSLRECLDHQNNTRGKPFNQLTVQHIMRQLCQVVAYLHSQGVIHRDIKLENIMLLYDNDFDRRSHNILKATVKLIDFGVARLCENGQMLSTLCGSPITMDPQRANMYQNHKLNIRKIIGDGYTQKADVWSLGAVCYQLLTGMPPFFGDTASQLLFNVKKMSHMLPEYIQLSTEAISFIDYLLQKDENKRPNIIQVCGHDFLRKNVVGFDSRTFKSVLNESDNNQRNDSVWNFFQEVNENQMYKNGHCYMKQKSEVGKKSNYNNYLNDNNNSCNPASLYQFGGVNYPGSMVNLHQGKNYPFTSNSCGEVNGYHFGNVQFSALDKAPNMNYSHKNYQSNGISKMQNNNNYNNSVMNGKYQNINVGNHGMKMTNFMNV